MMYKKTNKRTHNLNEAIKKFSLIFQLFIFLFSTNDRTKLQNFFKVMTSDWSRLYNEYSDICI